MDLEHGNDSLNEIDHPETRAKLEGIQEVVQITDAAAHEARGAVAGRRAAAEALLVAATHLEQQIPAINARVDTEGLDPDEAKLRINQQQQAAVLVKSLANEAREDSRKLRSKADGLNAAGDLAGVHFKSLVQKYERHKRMAEEEEDSTPPATAKKPPKKKPAKKKAKAKRKRK